MLPIYLHCSKIFCYDLLMGQSKPINIEDCNIFIFAVVTGMLVYTKCVKCMNNIRAISGPIAYALPQWE